MSRLAVEGWELVGGLGGGAALVWAVSGACDRLIRTVGGLAITYRAVFSADDRPIQRLQLVLGAGESPGGRQDDLDAPATPPAA